MRRLLLRLPLPPPCSSPAPRSRRCLVEGKSDAVQLPPMSPDQTIDQVVRIANREVRYKATVGHVDIRDGKGKVDRSGGVHRLYGAERGQDAAGHLRLQWRSGRGLRLPQLRRDRPEACQFGAQGDAPSDHAVAARQSQQLARLHRPGLHRSRRHWVLSAACRRRGDQEATSTPPMPTSSTSAASSSTGSTEERPNDRAPVSDRRKLWRLPRAARRLHFCRAGWVWASGITMVSPYLDPGAVDRRADQRCSPLP